MSTDKAEEVRVLKAAEYIFVSRTEELTEASRTPHHIQEILQASEYVLPYHWMGMDHNCLLRYLRLSDEIARMIQDHARPGVGLDIGCGDGRSTFEVQRRIGARFRLVGLDFDARAIHFARLFAPEVETRVTDATGKLPFTNESIQFLYSREVLEHVAPEYVDDFVGEQFRVLQPGGLAVVVVPSIRLRVPAKHYRHYTEPELSQVFGQFDKLEVCGFGRTPKGRINNRLFVLIDSLPGLWKLYRRRWVRAATSDADVLIGCFRKPSNRTTAKNG
jgi:SAM-dependent methyltransferase